MIPPLDILISETFQKGDSSIIESMNIIHKKIIDAIDNKTGLLIGRHGTIEFEVASNILKQGNVNPMMAFTLQRNAGIFPIKDISSWQKSYLEATATADCLAIGWYKPMAADEYRIVTQKNKTCVAIPLRSLEVQQHPEASWLKSLHDQEVAVVSSFTNTMSQQVDNLSGIWGERSSMLPSVKKWHWIRSQQSPVLAKGKCEWPKNIKSWTEAVDLMEKQVIESGARICLIGCGGLAMPLALRLKQKGLIAIVLGGSVQNLFGIRGKRWKSHTIISTFWNSHWVQPSTDEIPGGFADIEGGCQW